MIAEFGHFALTLALAVALAQATLPLVGAQRGDAVWTEMARPLAIGQFLCIAVAFGALTYAYLVSDFSVVNVARLSGVDAEEALQGAIEKFRRRFAGMEEDLTAQGKSIGSVSQAELEQSWQTVKAQERAR